MNAIPPTSGFINFSFASYRHLGTNSVGGSSLASFRIIEIRTKVRKKREKKKKKEKRKKKKEKRKEDGSVSYSVVNLRHGFWRRVCQIL
jgi:hypothetical protein